MKKVVIGVKQVVADIRARIGDAALMQKYSLSARSLINLKKELLARGAITPEDIKPSRTPPTPEAQPKPKRQPLSARRFVEDFREKPDDNYLMKKYNLSVSQLRKVYKKMIENRLLSEYEYYMREGIAPGVDLEPGAEGSPTTVIDMTQSSPQYLAAKEKGLTEGLPEDFFRDYSGIKIGKKDSDGKEVAANPSQDRGPVALRDTPTIVQLITTELCPNCLRPRDDLNADSCHYCGIVFAKVDRLKQDSVIWKDDLPRK